MSRFGTLGCSTEGHRVYPSLVGLRKKQRFLAQEVMTSFLVPREPKGHHGYTLSQTEPFWMARPPSRNLEGGVPMEAPRIQLLTQTPSLFPQTHPPCRPRLLNSPRSHAMSPPRTDRGRCCSCRRWSCPRKTQSHLEAEGLSVPAMLPGPRLALPPHLHLSTSPSSSFFPFQGTLGKNRTGDLPRGFPVSFPPPSMPFSRDSLSLRSQHTSSEWPSCPNPTMHSALG